MTSQALHAFRQPIVTSGLVTSWRVTIVSALRRVRAYLPSVSTADSREGVAKVYARWAAQAVAGGMPEAAAYWSMHAGAMRNHPRA